MLQPGQRVGAAVSGGADSVCLVHLLHELAGEWGISIRVVHLNHQLRGSESEQDEAFVRELAARLGFPVSCDRAPDLRSSSGNLEQAAREARRRFFHRLLAEGVVDRIATAHTRSDQAETVLLRLLRGTGNAGLAGILPVTAEGLVRPLIACSRAEVEEYLNERGLVWREDRSNADLSFLRNRVRSELLPLMERDYAPGISGILAATAEVARAEESYWAAETEALARRYFRVEGGAVIVEAAVLANLHPAVARRLVRAAIHRVKNSLRGIDLAHVEQVLELALHNEGHGRRLIPGVDVMRSFEWLRLAPPRTGPRQDRDYCYPVTPPFPRRFTPSGGGSICLELLDGTDALAGYNEEMAAIDWDRLAAPVELRNWHPGDWIELPGRAAAKLKSPFQEGRVPLWERQGWPLLVSGGEVVWTRRFGVAAGRSAGAATRRILRVFEVESGL